MLILIRKKNIYINEIIIIVLDYKDTINYSIGIIQILFKFFIQKYTINLVPK